MRFQSLCVLVAAFITAALCISDLRAQLIPELDEMAVDHPRLLLRPSETPYAISLDQLAALERDEDFEQMLNQIKGWDGADCQALAWIFTGDSTYAEQAIESMQGYNFSGGDTFHYYFHLREFALAYDWLYHYEGFTEEIKDDVRSRVNPLAQTALNQTYDHIFHNYIWMSACGVAYWAIATADEDSEADGFFNDIRDRFNDALYVGIEYLDGLPSEPYGYWSLYDYASVVQSLVAFQSAFDRDLSGEVREQYGNWLERHTLNVIHHVQPNMRYISWGDLQSGPNGGVTHEMAGILNMATWALNLPQGIYFDQWLAEKRGLKRFYGETAMHYMLYARHLDIEPQTPALSFVAGGAEQGGHFIARSGWDDGATLVAFGVKDHYGDHNHYDQGQFTIYRNEMLAVDPPVYRGTRGPQQPTDMHNTLLINGNKQRQCRGQWFDTLEKFLDNLDGGAQLETGDFLFYADSIDWAVCAGEFARAYEEGLLDNCVRQLLFIRPGTVIVVDNLYSSLGTDLTDVQWLLQLPSTPTVDGNRVSISRGGSWLRNTPLLPETGEPTVTSTDVSTQRVSYSYSAERTLTIAHLLEVGDGDPAATPSDLQVEQVDDGMEIIIGGRKFIFGNENIGYEVSETECEGCEAKTPGCDFNGDGRIIITDVIALLLYQLDIPGDLKADFNQDGVISIADAISMLIAMRDGTCPDAGALLAAVGEINRVEGLNADRTAYLEEVMPQLNLTPEEEAAFRLALYGQAGVAKLPRVFSLAQNSPNPFNPSTSISYAVPEGPSVTVSLKVYNIRGRLVRTLVDELREPGTCTVFWDGTDESGRQVSSGVYLYRMQAGDFVQTRKMVLLK